MFESEIKYIVENVYPSYNDYFDYRKKGSWGQHQLLRRGINAAISLYHLREHLPSNIRPSRKDLQCRELGYVILGDIANAAKHKKINQNDPKISDANQLFEVMTVTFYSDEQGEYTASQAETYLTLNDGTELDLADLLYSVMNMWRDILAELNILNLNKLNPISTDEPVSREKAKEKTAGMNIMQGQPYNFLFRHFRYNYQKGLKEPMDLTGRDVVFRVFKPTNKITLGVILDNESLNKRLEFDFEISLSDEQAIEYAKIESDIERTTFARSILDSSPQLQVDLHVKINTCLMERNNERD